MSVAPSLEVLGPVSTTLLAQTTRADTLVDAREASVERIVRGRIFVCCNMTCARMRVSARSRATTSRFISVNVIPVGKGLHVLQSHPESRSWS